MAKAETTAAPTARLIAITYMSDAAEYAFAARVLYESQHQRIASPQYLVISQSIESYLKAFIATTADPLTRFKGHAFDT